MDSVFLALIQSTPPNAYVAAAQMVESYAGWIESQDLPAQAKAYPAVGVATNLLHQLKQDAIGWIDRVFAAAARLPAAIAEEGPDIANEISQLSQLATQMQTGGGSAQLSEAIRNDAAILQQHAQRLSQQVQALLSNLQPLVGKFQNDALTAGKEAGRLHADIATAQQQLAQLWAELHHLQNATCLDKGKIRGVEARIDKLSAHLFGAQTLLPLFAQAQTQAQAAAQGTGYLNAFWQSVVNDAQQGIAALARVQSDPDFLLTLDLTTTLQNWHQFVADAAQSGEGLKHLT